MEIRHDPLLLAKIRGFMAEGNADDIITVNFEGRPAKMIQVYQREYDKSIDGEFNPPYDTYFWFTDNDQVAVLRSCHINKHTMSLESGSTVIVEKVASHFDMATPRTVPNWAPKKV